MSTTNTLLRAIIRGDYTSANRAFAQCMEAAVSTRLATEKTRLFAEAYSDSDRETVARLVSKTLTGTIYPPGKTPEEMVNNAIKVWLSQNHTSNQWNIGAQMLQRAQTVGIKWDIGLMRRKFADFMLKKWGLVEETDTMTDAQMKKREEIVKSMKDNTQEFKDKYGDRWKDVMYATATKQAMSEDHGSGYYVMKGHWTVRNGKGDWSTITGEKFKWFADRVAAEGQALRLNLALSKQEKKNGVVYWVVPDSGVAVFS